MANPTNSPFAQDLTQADFAGLYTDTGAPHAVEPSDALYATLSDAAKAATTGSPATSSPAPAPAPAPAAAPASTPAPAPAPAAPPAATPAAPTPEAQALLTRLAPKGITSLDQLKGKTDAELRALSQDVVNYEMRQKSLNQYFKKNADGTFDLTTGPDGTPTGLDATGKTLPPAGTTPAPAPAPAAAPKPAPKPAAKAPAKKTTVKKAPAKRTTVHKTTTKRTTVKKAPAKKAPAKPAAKKVTLAKGSGYKGGAR